MGTAMEPWRRDFDEWRAIKLLGEGNSGTVLEVENTLDGRHAALKVLHRRLMADGRAARRFRNEVQAIRKIKSEHVVQILAEGITSDGAIYLVTELIQGQTLAERLLQGPVSVPEAVAMGEQIARALAAAHEAGVVHRDLKPANILLEGPMDNAEPHVKVIDFGVAKMLGPCEPEAQTQSGRWVGTRAYMSSDQWMTLSDIDGRADLYSLGVVLFECLTGELPYQAHTDVEWFRVHTEGAVADIASRKAVPPRLASLITSLLAKHPSQRPPDAKAVIAALRECHAATLASDSTPYPAAGQQATVSSTQNSTGQAGGGAILLLTLCCVVLGGPASNISAQPQPPLPEPSPIPKEPLPVRVPGPSPVEPSDWIDFPGFRLARYEVSRADYREFHDEYFPGQPYPWDGIGDYENTKLRPVSLVSAIEAQRYCAWRYPEGGRLPTPTEWQQAAVAASVPDASIGQPLGRIRLKQEVVPADFVSTRDEDYAQGSIRIVNLFGNVAELVQAQKPSGTIFLVCGSSSASTQKEHGLGETCRRAPSHPDSFVGFRCAVPNFPGK